MKVKLVVFILTLISTFTFLLNAQDYDVLTVEDKDKLFNQYLLSEFDSIVQKRKETVQNALSSKAALLAYQSQMYDNYTGLIGEFPEKIPLNATIVDTIVTNKGYRIEKLHYLSRPNHHVTANFYIPETGTGPYPTVVILCGHYPAAKSYVDYQNLSILFAKNGIAAFIIDPICQGERYQFHDAEGKLLWEGTSGTSALSKLDVGTALNGSSTGAHLLWDNHRGMDYLYSRTDVVDTSKIGCTGHSGGGGQATNLLVYDKRLKAGAVANYITNETHNFKVLGPQTAPQNLAFEGEYGFDTPDYITLFAPKPYLIIGTTTDFFEIEGTRETFAGVQTVYDTLGAKEKVELFETTDVHDFTKIKREKAVRWFKYWFTGNNDTVIEADQVTLPTDTLNVTGTGQVYTEFPNEMTVQDINLEIALKDSVSRKEFWANNTKDSILNAVKHLILLEENYEDPVQEVIETIDRGTYTIDKLIITSGNNVPITGLLFKPKNLTMIAPATLYLHGNGKDKYAGEGGIFERQFVNKGAIVLAVDVRGLGETADNTSMNDSKHGNKEFRNAVISLYTGKTLVGQRVEDILNCVYVLMGDMDVDPGDITIEAIGPSTTAALHAAALNSGISNVILRKGFQTWLSFIEDPAIPDGMTHQVNSALKYYDLPDLVRAISPATVSFKKSNDASLRLINVSKGELSPAFSPGITEYTITDLRSNEITLKGFVSDENATVTGDGTFDVSNNGKTIKIVVTAEDGESTIAYTVTIPLYVSEKTNEADNNNDFLGQNYPNPFSTISTIDFTMTKQGNVSIEILTIDGRKAATLVNEEKMPGNYQSNVNARNFDPGVYYYQFMIDGRKEGIRKMIVVD